MRRHVPLLAAALLCTAADEPAPEESLLHGALNRIGQLYLHRESIEPGAMLRAGVQRLESGSPDVLVLEEAPGTLLVRSGLAEMRVDTASVGSLDAAGERMDEVIGFVLAGRGADGGVPRDELGDPLDRDGLEVEAVRGMLRTIDRHSLLIVGEGLDEFNSRFKGTLVGIGSSIGRRDGELRVLRPFPGSPAARAGLLAGDAITHIDGHSTQGLSVDDAVERIRGPEGVPVVLTVQRAGEPGRRVFPIVRENVVVPSIESELLPEGVGYIFVDHFSQKTATEFSEHLDGLKEKAGDLRGVVIDLRGNTGGSMRHATRIVNYFVGEGQLLLTEGSGGSAVDALTPRIDARAELVRFTGPVAVLVDRRTASGSEILAGGLKFLERSITIGAQTFGKATVQKVYPLRKVAGDEASMKLTVARYILPGGSFVNSVGVTPDIATGSLWLDPDEPTLPELIAEPPELTGDEAGIGGLDSRRNPGGGRETMTGGSNAEPVLRLMYPRVVPAWDDPSAMRGGDPGDRSGDDGPSATVPGATPAAPPPGARPGWSDLAGDAGEAMFNDVELRLAWELLSAASQSDRRPELLEAAGPLVADWQRLQADRMGQATGRRGIPWSADPIPLWMDRSPRREEELQAHILAPPPADIDVTLHLPERLEAGQQDAAVRLEVRNGRPEPLRHLRARMESSAEVLDGVSFLIGDVAPGMAAGWTVPLAVPADAPTRLDTWRLYLLDDSGPLGGPFTGLAESRGAEPPALALRVETQVEARADGLLVITASVKVRNDGRGPAGDVEVHFGEPRSEAVERLDRFGSIRDLEPAAAAEVELRLQVRDATSLPSVPIRLRALDTETGTSTMVALEIPTAEAMVTGWLRPPEIEMSSPRGEVDAPPSRGGVGFVARGLARAQAGLASLEVSVSGDEVYSSRLPPGTTEASFEAGAVLELGPNRVRVEAETADGVIVGRSFWVLGEKPEAAEGGG